MRSLIYYKVKNRRLALDLSHFQLNFLCATRDIRTHTNYRHCVGGSTHAGLAHFLRKHCKTYRARGAEHRRSETDGGAARSRMVPMLYTAIAGRIRRRLPWTVGAFSCLGPMDQWITVLLHALIFLPRLQKDVNFWNTF